MEITDLLKHKLICKISSDWKDNSNYTDQEFEVDIYEDANSDSGYSAKIKGLGDEAYVEDGQRSIGNISSGIWLIQNKISK